MNERNDPPSRRPDRGPRLLLLGEPDLTGAEAAPRSSHRCLETVAYIHFYPRVTVSRLCEVFCTTSGSVRWTIAQARQWLGADRDGLLYLPQAYTGGYQLTGSVSSDLNELCSLAPAADLSTGQLHAALRSSRGPVFAGNPPHTWGWAEGLRIQATEAIRDIAHEVTRRALNAGELQTARWAAAHGLDAAPEDEQLLADRLRTELAAGATGETLRLAARIRYQAAQVGIPPLPETAQLLARSNLI